MAYYNKYTEQCSGFGQLMTVIMIDDYDGLDVAFKTGYLILYYGLN